MTKVSAVRNVFPFIVHLGGAPRQTQIICHIGAPAVAKILTNIYSQQQGLITIVTKTFLSNFIPDLSEPLFLFQWELLCDKRHAVNIVTGLVEMTR